MKITPVGIEIDELPLVVNKVRSGVQSRDVRLMTQSPGIRKATISSRRGLASSRTPSMCVDSVAASFMFAFDIGVINQANIQSSCPAIAADRNAVA